MKNIDLAKIKKVHFVGIGGVGVSAIARMMLLEKKRVSGSDQSSSLIITELEKLGAKVFIGHNADNIADDVDLLVYTPAVTEENLELKKARKLNILTFSYPEILGLISQNKHTIAISGTHGKTTTTAMIGKILVDAKKEPTIIVGSLLKEQGSNFVAGESEYLVVEACEYKRSFLNLESKIAVITNIDDDHLDYYGNLENIKKAFAEFVSKLPKDGYLVCDPNDINLKDVVKKTRSKIIDYSKIKTDFNLKIPGEHNIKNAKVAMSVAEILMIKKEKALNSLNNFSGTWRRFEYKGKSKNGIIVYDDYGHHPTEIKATLSGARELYPKSKIIVVFQPHLYSRTKSHLVEFGRSFKNADLIIVAPIYEAREKNDLSINSQILAEEIKKSGKQALCFKTFSEIEKYITSNDDKNSVVITMGAGDIYKVSDSLIIF